MCVSSFSILFPLRANCGYNLFFQLKEMSNVGWEVVGFSFLF